ncbi:MAG TPA: hypothetical protein VGQ53_01555 [Chitinophagaceae bacterium]|jgi:hypothetical protein|nr:hypothetical protein [Chitinophagaceae bacterium]
MEVHAHSHTERKKFTHYLWEFLMLFLAVFCGFLAENFREHEVEKERATQYMLSLYEDLKTDTTRLNEMFLYDDDKIAALNGMETCYDSITMNQLSTECMTKLILHSRANRSFAITDRTITQLVNAGGFRILNKDDADRVLNYVNAFKGYQDFQSTIFQSSQDNVRNTLNELAGFKSAASLLQIPGSSYGSTTSTITPEMTAHGPLLFSNNKFLLNKWFNQLSVYLRITKAQRLQLAGLKDEISGLIKYCKGKYHLQ